MGGPLGAEEGLEGQAPARVPGVRGPFLSVKALLACRPTLPYPSCREEGEGRLFSTRASALTTAPKCLLRGPADFPSPRTRRPTLPAAAAVRFGVSYSARPQHPLPRITPHPSPSRQEARAQDFHFPVAPGQVMWRSRDAGARGRRPPRIGAGASRPAPSCWGGIPGPFLSPQNLSLERASANPQVN